MANIIDKITAIRTAILGKEVRENIASGIETINTEVESTTIKQNELETIFNDLIINAGSSNAEIVAARKGEVSLPVKIEKLDSELADMANVKTNPSKLTKTINKMFSGGVVKIVAHGDSTTYGDTGAGRSLTPYPETMQTRLRSIYGNNNITVVNKGVNGQQSDEALALFDSSVVPENPDCVIIMFGINDASGAILPVNTLEQYRTNITSMVKKCYDNGCEVLLMAPTPTFFMRSDINWFNATNRKIFMYGLVVEEIAKAYNCGFLNLHNEIEKLYSSKSESMITMQSSVDYLHFIDHGYIRIAEIIAYNSFDIKSNGTLRIDSNKDLYISACRNKYIDTDCTVDYAGSIQEFYGRHYSLSSDGVGGTYINFEFFISEKNMDLIIMSPKNPNGGKVTVYDNGVSVGDVDFYAPDTSLFDVENIIIQNMAIGYHKVEFKVANMVQGQAISIPYYVGMSAFKFTKTKVRNDLFYVIGGGATVYSETFKSVINSPTYRFKAAANKGTGVIIKDADSVQLKNNKTLVVEIEGMFFNNAGISWFCNLAGDLNTLGVNYGYVLNMYTSSIGLFQPNSANNGAIELATHTIAIDFNISHKVRIEHKHDGVIKIYFDGVLVITTTPSLKIREGYFGLQSGSPTTPQTIELKRFEYCYIDS